MVRLNKAMPLEHARTLLAGLSERVADCYEHADRVVSLAERIAQRLGLPERDIAQVRLAAELHDLGKVDIPPDVLASPQTLDRDAWETMKSHTVLGERILADSGDPALIAIAPYVRHHHECVSGNGYPDGLVGEQIPLVSRIIAVADAYDAMAERRPYRDAKSHQRIIEVMTGEVGIRWDPEVFAAFLAVVKSDRALASEPRRSAAN
ncbi:HD domain-containing protein [Niveibacterium umoris]|uniref:HD-GYP domain-containing protein (C-di-GMP phosphodiesterase class II) n=1 Tax=Niveibacterium umoris TaxID=1193620 RepID=A0A840BNQ4_9RHOO|nr:HD domain-containing phosphohydrolase [Niveibacterium umoris]MBB4014263.1 HD-GYP domain-containing protein (c-di-GMP phosphodiesterase class II) [Niveibacterium umoris]